MANKVYSYYTELPSWAKGVVVVGGIAIVYFTAKQFINRIKDQAEKKKQRDSVITQKSELDNMLKTGARLTYAPSQYKTWSNQIVENFRGCDVGNSNVVFFGNVISKLRNDADFLALSTSFDIQTYKDCFSWFNADFSGNLSQAVSNEFTDKEIQMFNNTLRDMKITYRF